MTAFRTRVLGFGAAMCVAFGGVIAAASAKPPAPDAATLALGERAFAQCKGCHALDANGRDMVGPNLFGVIGTKAGTHSATFKYSAAMKASNLTWDEATLDTFLAGPSKAVPGTKMPYRGLADPAQRKALIAYIRVKSGQ